MAYMSMKTAIFTALFGIQEDKLVKKAVPLSSRSPGIFGQAQALTWQRSVRVMAASMGIALSGLGSHLMFSSALLIKNH
jgi:hypothetical protein